MPDHAANLIKSAKALADYLIEDESYDYVQSECPADHIYYHVEVVLANGDLTKARKALAELRAEHDLIQERTE